MDNNSKYGLFKKYFNIKADNFYRKILHSYISKNLDSGRLEYSVKTSGINIYPERINIWYSNNFKSYFQGIISLMNKLGLSKISGIDNKLLSRFFHNFDFNKCESLIFGFDIRERIEDSRIKLWVDFFDYPEKVKEAQELVNFTDYPFINIWRKQHPSSMLFGLDLHLNGGLEYKAYPFVTTEKNVYLASNDILDEFMRASKIIHISKKDDYILHFHLRHSGKFINLLRRFFSSNIDIDYHNYLIAKDFKLNVVSLFYNQLMKKAVKDFNFYYW